ncbi:MAG: FMN-binding protein [Ruminococcaceae bacterium]|nr:FMN-binding protein [Oscillospiraceae bacterium]
MRRFAAALLAVLLCGALLAGCQADTAYADGTYYAEFEEYDSYGYKEYMRVTVEDGAVTALEYNAMDADGALRTQDEKYRQNMESVNDTYPEKYTADLVNQFMENKDIDKLDAIAGATWSSDSFKALYKALLLNMAVGDTNTVLVENVPEK